MRHSLGHKTVDRVVSNFVKINYTFAPLWHLIHWIRWQLTESEKLLHLAEKVIVMGSRVAAYKYPIKSVHQVMRETADSTEKTTCESVYTYHLKKYEI